MLIFLIAAVSALYAMAGQAGGTGFVAAMALTSVPADEIRTTALTLNIVAAGYATARLAVTRSVDWSLLGTLLAASAPAAFLGACISLNRAVASVVTGSLLLAACVALIVQRTTVNEGRKVATPVALIIGAGTGFASGLSGIGGGVFLAPLLIMLGGMLPKRVAGLSPPFILANSVVGLAGVLFAGQRLSFAALPLMAAALIGSVIGTAVGLRWHSDKVVRYFLVVILAVAGGELLIRV